MKTLIIYTFCSVINLCADEPCLNGGACLQVSGSTYLCVCPNEFMGANCENGTYFHCFLFSFIWISLVISKEKFPLHIKIHLYFAMKDKPIYNYSEIQVEQNCMSVLVWEIWSLKKFSFLNNEDFLNSTWCLSQETCSNLLCFWASFLQG